MKDEGKRPTEEGMFNETPPRLGLTRSVWPDHNAAHVLGAKGRGTHICVPYARSLLIAQD